jgi:drug/metabolite transporter (DMT)-like permease
MPGIYSVLKSSLVIIYIFVYWILYKIPIDKVEWCGIIFFIISLIIISCILLNSKSYNFEGKSFYKITTFRKILAAFLIVIVLFVFGIMDNLYTQLSNKTFVDIFISSIGPLIFSTIVILIKYMITKKIGFPGYKYTLPLFCAFLFIYYIPMMLDYGIINYAPKLLILIFFNIQIVVGILIDKYYYKKNISNKELIYISILIISSIVCIYGFHMNTKTHTSIDLSTSTGSKNTIIVTPEAEEEEFKYTIVLPIVRH